ncbi:MAG: hypothetical protein A2Y76_02265 [Planctomycetes bacterium RBG_13_60_9]|jgi:branched-chain amino acid transport system permease protein|nr:MAG: hypothetical protein A2Y76_02265 [Planctomycetes bacterium RBG_13_60_9]
MIIGAGWSRRRIVEAIRSWISLSLIIALIVLVTHLWGNRAFGEFVTSFLILSIFVVAWHIWMGNSGITSFGHASFFAVGAYLSALLTIPPGIKDTALPSLPIVLRHLQLGLVPTVLIAAIATGVVALAIGIVFARMAENAMGMATFALLVMVYTLLLNWNSVTRGGRGVYGVPREVTPTIALIGLVLVLGTALLFKASPTGLRLQGARDDPLAARSLGIHLFSVRLTGWVLSAIVMGAGGSLWAQNVLAFGPDSFFFRDTFSIIAMMIFGGQASVTGALTGCALISVISEIMRFPERGLAIGSLRLPELPGAVQLTIALLILATLMLRPSGLLGSYELGFALPHWLKPKKRNTTT